MSSEDVVIDVRNVSKRYEIYATPRDRLKQLALPRVHGVLNRCASAIGATEAHAAPQYFKEFWALRNVSFQVRRGETMGIIGRNGGGKSTLLQIIAGTMSPTVGDVDVQGRVAALLELGSGFNPEFSGRENVYLNGRILGLSQEEIEARYERIVEFAEIGDFIDEPVKTYSSGMFLRLAFSVQAFIDASVVIIDEALAVGDVFFRKKCYARLDELRSSGAAILLVSHSMSDIEQYCKRAVLLDKGEVKYVGGSSEAAKHYYLIGKDSVASVVKEGRESIDDQVGNSGESLKFPRPPHAAYIDISTKVQVGTGQAKCVGVAICDKSGQPSRNFKQGDIAVFVYEFEIDGEIGVPICGLVISNERGVIVHGKNNWQVEQDVATRSTWRGRLVCRQEVRLDIAVGDYLIEVGLAAVSENVWSDRKRISHEEFSAVVRRVCHLPDVGMFSVGLAVEEGVGVLRHHGIADLPGSISIGWS